MSSNGYNFTERVRRVLSGAREESHRMHHEYVGTEHILLAILGDSRGVAMSVLQNLNIDLNKVRWNVHDVVKPGNASSRVSPDLPYTSRSKRVLELALAEAEGFKHNYVSTEHLLLGLIREERGIAAQVLAQAGLTLEDARAETLRILGVANPDGSPAEATSAPERLTDQPDEVPIVGAESTSVKTVSIEIAYEDGTVRRESFSGTLPAMGFLGAVHRRQMDA